MIGFARGRRRAALMSLGLLALGACGGGGDGGGSGIVEPPPTNPPPNSAPVADAGVDRSAVEGAEVALEGGGSDADGDTLTYRWTQIGGTPVSIVDADAAQASFVAPAIDANLGASVALSGTVSYEFVPPNDNCRGLDFDSVETRPVRGATLQVIDFGAHGETQGETLEFELTVSDGTDSSTDSITVTVGNVHDSVVVADDGTYSFAAVPANASVSLRLRAELKRPKKPGEPGWDVEVRDNFIPGQSDADDTQYATRPLYVVDGAQFETGSTDVQRNLTARTGWGDTSYTSPRAAAPFAILDAIYSAIQFVLEADSSVDFPPLDAFWSVNNTIPESPRPIDITAGELGASFYRGDIDSLFLLGDADVDTEEFDDHVVVHEWGHYFEDTLSRTDSIGGPHRIGERIDARLAFGEGWATAFAAMALDNTLYCDTGPAGSNAGFGIGADTGSHKGQGWYDEISVLRFLYDLYDTTDEVDQIDGVPAPGTDSGSIGWQPIYDVMTGPQAFTPAFTTVFSFAAELKNTLADQADRDLVDEQLAREFIDPAGLDIFGTTETNDAGGGRDVLPVYTELTPDGSVTSLCVNSDFDTGREGNKLAEYRYLRFNIVDAGVYDVEITTRQPTDPPLPPDDPSNARDQSDPDIAIFRDGTIVATGFSPDANSERFQTQTVLQPGVHVADLTEFRFADPDTSADFPGQVCFDVSISRQ